MPWPLKGRMFIAQPFYDTPIQTTELPRLSRVTPNNSSSYLLSSSHNTSSSYLSSSTLSTLSRTPAQVLLLFTSGATGIAKGDKDNNNNNEKGERELFIFPQSHVNPWVIDINELSLGSILDSSRNWEVFASILRGNRQVIVQRFLNQKMNDKQLLDLRAETATLRYFI